MPVGLSHFVQERTGYKCTCGERVQIQLSQNKLQSIIIIIIIIIIQYSVWRQVQSLLFQMRVSSPVLKVIQ